MNLDDAARICKQARLPATQEQVIVLAWVYLLPPPQIAERLQVTIVSVQRRLWRAQAAIRRMEKGFAVDDRETVREHAEGLWEAMRRLNCCPQAPVYDDDGKSVRIHAQAVSLDDYVAVVRRREKEAVRVG